MREYSFSEPNVRGVTYDGTDVWFCTGDRLQAFSPQSGAPKRSLPVKGDAGTAFDGEFFYQIVGDRIVKVDPHTGATVSSIPAPGGSNSGLTWAEGSLWVGGYKDRTIRQLDPGTGKVLRTMETARFVTGITFAEGELWHATWEDGKSDLRRVDVESGEVAELVELPEDVNVSGVEYDGEDLFYCGGASGGKVRAVRRPRAERTR